MAFVVVLIQLKLQMKIFGLQLAHALLELFRVASRKPRDESAYH